MRRLMLLPRLDWPVDMPTPALPQKTYLAAQAFSTLAITLDATILADEHLP